MIAAASKSLENGSSHLPEIQIGGEMTEANTSLGSLRICVDRDSAYEQNEVETPRVECGVVANVAKQIEEEIKTGN